MGIIRGTHTSPGIYTQITDIINAKKQPTTRVGAIGYNTTKNHNKNNNGGGDKPKPSVKNYLTFTALEDNCSIGFYNNPDSSIEPTVEYSFDKNTWNVLTEDRVSIPQSTNMYCRGINPEGISGGYEESGYNYFIGEGKFNVSGDIMTLIDYNTIPETMVGTFYNLFGRHEEDFVDIVDASKLVLSAKVLTSDCYQRMFDSCISMTYCPQFKTEVLAPYCYHTIFFGCGSLTIAPALPVTTLAEGCYHGMFSNCTSLTKSPELPATELTTGCYNSMFYNCTNLTKVPNELPATTLADYCYESMFQGCTSLTTAPELPATTLADNCYYQMFMGCSSLTTAPELPATTLTNGCYGGMFYNCTSLTVVPTILPATELSNSCYYDMFRNCTKLLIAPELPATTLTDHCYYFMFSNCPKLHTIKCLATDMSENLCKYNWVYNVSNSGVFIKHPNATWSTGDSGIPSGWTVEDAVL